MIAAITLSGLLSFLFFAGLVCFVCWVLVKLVDYVAPPAPIGKAFRVIIVVCGVFIFLYLLLGFVGVGGVSPVIRWN